MFIIEMLYILYLLLIVVLVSIDQFSKYLIVSNVALDTKDIVLVKNFFNITYVRNYGAGFSILQNQRLFLVLVSFVAVIVVAYLLVKSKNNETISRICYLLIIGGAIGNMIDRLLIGYVVDFLDFNIFGYDFPVFNLADCFITIGCFLLMFVTLLEIKNERN